MSINGTAGNDTLTGTAGADTFDLSQGGDDKAYGLDDNDTFRFGGALTGKDKIDGGNGTDTVTIDGDYSAGLKLHAGTFTSVERLTLAAGHTYDITTNDANFSGLDSVIDASALGRHNQLILDAHDETDARLFIYGGAGDDVLTGGQYGDYFQLYTGGSDTAIGGAGPDIFLMNGAFDPGDVFDGKDGTDIVMLNGDYSAGLTLTQSMTRHIEIVQVMGNFTYDLTADPNLIGAGESMIISGSPGTTGTHLDFDGSAVKNGVFTLQSSPGDDVLIGGNANDTFSNAQGSDDYDGRKGNDTFRLYGDLDPTDTINGGKDYDTISLQGDYSAGLTLASSTIKNIEEISFVEDGHAYDIATSDHNVAAGEVLNTSAFGVTSSITFNGIAETDGSFVLKGGNGDDTLTGGENDDTLYGYGGADRLNGYHGNDVLTGGPGGDTFNGGLGNDTYVISSAQDSTSTGYDRTLSFDADEDRFSLLFGPSAIAPTVHGGALSTATFDTDLAAAIGAGELPAGEAVRFKPTSGDLAGRLFLIVDGNGSGGYSPNGDYVIRLDHHKHMADFSVDNFI